jgi:hypothetical protein
MTVLSQRAAAAARPSLLDRALSAYPIAVAYLTLLVLYAWQTTRHSTPWLFTDELQWAKQAYGVAHTGHPQLRLNDVGITSLYPYFIAPAWWLGATDHAYAAAKYLNAAAMAASIFPAYGLARLFVPRWPAHACAVATASIPAAAYTGLLIPEPLAYAWSTLAVWLLARALLRTTRWGVALSAAALMTAGLVRSELIVLLAAAVLALVLLAVTGSRGRALIASWTWLERCGAALIATGGLIVLNAILTHHSFSWQIGTHFWHRAVTYGLWAVGALTIGIGVLPVFAALAWLLGSRWRATDERVLAATLTATVVAFGTYTAVKASYLSTTFAIRVEERNVIYIAPLVFVATARWLVAGRARVLASVASAAGVAYLLHSTPYHNYDDFYSDAPGVTILQWLNRKWYWTTIDARRLLFGILIGAIVLAVARELSRRRRRATGLTHGVVAALGVAVVGWNLTGEIVAANASNNFSKPLRNAMPTPPNWIDNATGRSGAMFIGEALSGSNAFWSLEFWNQSIEYVWSVDGTAPGPGRTITPNFWDTRGTLDPQLPLDWAIAQGPVRLAGRVVENAGGLRLYRLSHPIRMIDEAGGITPDGWMSSNAWFIRFGRHGAAPGTATVSLTRGAACNDLPPPHVTIRVSALRLTPDRQPLAGSQEALRHVVVPTSKPCATRIVRLQATPPFLLTVTADRTFEPSQYDPRQLSAQVGFGFDSG